MKRARCYKSAQSYMEYAMLIIIISAALVAMQHYIRRAINVPLRNIQVELSESQR